MYPVLPRPSSTTLFFFRKLNYPFIVKFYGAALLEKSKQARAILVMELCKEDLRRHIFLNAKNIPGLPSSTVPTDRNTIRWAENIADALGFVHSQGFVHRNLRLEKILVGKKEVSFPCVLLSFSLFFLDGSSSWGVTAIYFEPSENQRKS